jgi:hypothetical protein
VAVHWTKEDPAYEHEGTAVLIGADGNDVPNPRGVAWFTLPEVTAEPNPNVKGLQAVCGCGWQGAEITGPVLKPDTNLVDVDAWEDAALIAHHNHVREAAGTELQRKLSLATASAIVGIATAEGLRGIDRLRLLVEAERSAGSWRADAVAEARSQGSEWSEIGDALLTSKQAAQQRYGTKVTPR